MADDTSLIGRLRASILNATVTQRFGCTGFSMEPTPWWNTGSGCQHFHTGVDFRLPGGTRANVYSPASGVVTRVDTNPNVGYGYSVRLRDPQGLTWIIGHLAQLPRVAEGDQVEAGTILGNQGSTGASTAPHVHLEVRNAQNIPLNPAHNPEGEVVGSGISNGITPGDIFYGLAHVFGFGAGPSQGGIQVPPDPVTGGVPASQVTGGTGPGSGTTGGSTSDPGCIHIGAFTWCPPGQGPAPGFSWGSGAPGESGPNIVEALFPGAGYQLSQNVVPVAVVTIAGAVLVLSGLRLLGREKPVQAVTQTVAPVGKVAGAVATKGASLVTSKA